MSCHLPAAQTLIQSIEPCAASLERIEIEGAAAYRNPVASSDGKHTTKTIHLPRLKLIQLFAPPHYTEDVLNRLRYPSDALTRLDLRDGTYLSYAFDITDAICAKYPQKWAAFRMYDDGPSIGPYKCYLDLYSRTPELLAAIEERPCLFHAATRPSVSFRITPHDDRAARHIIRELGIDAMDVQCASFALDQIKFTPYAVPILASQARTVVIQCPNKGPSIILNALSHPFETEDLDSSIGEPVWMPDLKHLYLHARPGGLNEVHLMLLATRLRWREWHGVQLHIDAALHLRGNEGLIGDTVQAEFLASFENVHWGEQLTGNVNFNL